tara:strand:- start:838 stop:1092 length:255 start_codon:yes stop_codon:yes gene_type:complete
MNDTVKKKEIVLDTSGTECPIPVLKARKLSQSLKDGCEVVVIATDPLAEQDFKHYCEESNFKYLDCVKKNNKSIIRYIYKSKTN